MQQRCGHERYDLDATFFNKNHVELFVFVGRITTPFMLLLFVISGMSARFYLNGHSDKEFLKSRTTKLLVPSTIGLFVFWWILGYYNMMIGGAFENMSAVPKPLLYGKFHLHGVSLLLSVSKRGNLPCFALFSHLLDIRERAHFFVKLFLQQHLNLEN